MIDLFSWRPAYPASPGCRRTDTSRRAADEIAPAAGTIRAKVLATVRDAGPAGLTPDECAARLGLSILTVRPRFSELKLVGLVRDGGARRRNAGGRSAIVWIASGREC